MSFERFFSSILLSFNLVLYNCHSIAFSRTKVGPNNLKMRSMKDSYIYIAELDHLDTFIYALKIRQRDSDMLPEILGKFSHEMRILFKKMYFFATFFDFVMKILILL